MPASKVGVRVRFRTQRADEIAAKAGKETGADKSAFFGVTQSNWSRVTSTTENATDPGALFIAAVLASEAAEQYPDEVTFDNLFEVGPA